MEASSSNVNHMANGEPRSFAPRILPSQSSSRHQALDSGSRLKRVADNIITNLTRKGTYEYDPIDCNNDIRILRIHHGPRGSELKCMLFPSALTSKSTHARHPYWALSYWWGEPNEVPKNKIRIFKDTGARDGKQVLTPLHKSDTFYIRDNLKAALERFRDPEEDVNVWVDAICINQNDKTEKNAQVSRMHEVYMQARNVCIWLGEGRDETEETFRFLQKILDLHQLDGLISDPKSNSPKWALVVGLMANRWFSRRWVIQELALSQQATVRWGKMELEWIHFADAIALFMTKYEEIKRTSLDPANYHKDLDARALGANTIIHATVNLFRKSPDGRVEQRLLPLEILVSSLLLAFEAGEPRDTIFAVLTLAKDSSFGTAGLEEDPRIAPDYKKPLLDVYTDFMDFCIEKSRSLDILCRYWAPLPKPEEAGGKRSPQDREESMPSWIPFITKSAFGEPHAVRGGRRNGDSLVGGPERKGQQTYNACGGVRSWHRFGTNEPSKAAQNPLGTIRRATFQVLPNKQDGSSKTGRKGKQKTPTGLDGRRSVPSRPFIRYTGKYDGSLFVRGFCIGTIDVVSERVSGNGVIPEDAFSLAGWKPDGPIDQEVPDQLWRTLVADRGPNGTSAPSWYRRACWECLQRTDNLGDLDLDDLKKDDSTPSTMVTYLERVHRMVWKRRFFTARSYNPKKNLSTKYFGLGSPNVKVDDKVCIFFGCSVPVVVRRIDLQGQSPFFQFIGECYVHGMMDGEAVADKLPNYPYTDRRYNTFELR